MKDKTLSIIQHPEFGTIRTEIINGEPWLCANDVCKALNLQNPRQAIKHCFEDDVHKMDIGVITGNKQDGSPATQRVKMNFINESGMYALIFNSEKEAAKKFKHWVTSEVLPQLRKNGYYGVEQKSETAEISQIISVIENCLLRDDSAIMKIPNQIDWDKSPIKLILNSATPDGKMLSFIYDTAQCSSKKNESKNKIALANHIHLMQDDLNELLAKAQELGLKYRISDNQKYDKSTGAIDIVIYEEKMCLTSINY